MKGPTPQRSPAEELPELRRQLADAQAAFAALAAGQVDSITHAAGPVLLRAAQDALLRSEENFRALIEQLPDQVWVHRHGRIVYVNLSTLHALGYEREQLVGREVLDLVVPEDRPAARARMEAGYGLGERVPRYEVRMLRRDGGRVIVEVSAQRVVFDGELAILKVAHDITQRRALEAHLLVADRMASIGMLAAGVAHEINNPLAYVIANLRFVAEEIASATGIPGASGWSDALAEAQEGAARVRGIVRDLKAFSRSEDAQSAPVDLHRMLNSAANMAANEIRHCARLVKDYSLAPLAVEGNESRLGQVFLNLLVNAAQAIPDGAADRNEIRLVTRAEPDGRILVEVRDTGPGMTPQVLGRLFTPFFTTKPKGVGTGLGLSICHQIISTHGGEIRVESEPGRGTLFRVWLPPAGAEVVATRALPVMLPVGQRGRVLIVDDEILLGSAISRVLSRHHAAVVVGSGKEALQLLATDSNFDVILCDMMMPEMSGPQLYEEIAALRPELAGRMVFLSGGAFTESARAFLDRIPNLRLDKPFEIGQLLSVIAQFLLRA